MPKLLEKKDMTGRLTLVTGAGGKLGNIICKTLCELNSNLIIVDRPGTQMKCLANYLRSHSKILVKETYIHLESEQDRKLLFKEISKDFKKLNCLINNATFVGTSSLEGWSVDFYKQSLKTWRRAFEG